jgi:hypothetical protein
MVRRRWVWWAVGGSLALLLCACFLATGAWRSGLGEETDPRLQAPVPYPSPTWKDRLRAWLGW